MKSLKEMFEHSKKFYATIIGIPIVGIVIQELIHRAGEKGVITLKKRVEEILGLNLEDAKKDVGDEILYGVAVSTLKEDEQKEIDCFERKLRAKPEDKEKAEAFVLYIAKIVKTFEREITVPNKGKGDPKIDQTYKKLEEGLGHARNFMRALLRNSCHQEDDTFKSRVDFLEGKNVFSLIKVKKESPLKNIF